MRPIAAYALLTAGLLLAAPALGAQAAPGRVDAARVAAARRLLDASGVARTMVAAMKQSIPAQRQATPELPAEFWTRFEARLTADLPLLVDSIAVVYATHLSVAELDNLTAFYRSPLGQKLVEVQPILTTESMQVGQRWGMRIGSEIGSSLQPDR